MRLTVTLLPQGQVVSAPAGVTISDFLHSCGVLLDAPCGGKGTCGKCKVLLDGREVLACQTTLTTDCTVTLPQKAENAILTRGLSVAGQPDGQHPYVLAFDVGTTTVVCYLLSGVTGTLLATASALNPQTSFGADVIARIQAAMDGQAQAIQACILETLAELTRQAADQAGIAPQAITLAAIVGNTAMHHLLLAIDPTPLTTPPYMPQIFEALELPAKAYLPISPTGTVRLLPNIAGFVGADTVGCLVSTRFDTLEDYTLMIDIGTNGEMVLGNRTRRIACSTAAGPAFEGAKISSGMRGAAGAIDKVWAEQGKLRCHVIGEGQAQGICGSGLLDAVYTMLETGMITESGRMDPGFYDPDAWRQAEGLHAVALQDGVLLTQKDVRELQLAKAAIRAGIELLAKKLDIVVEQIQKVYLAGAFGNYLSPKSACGIGLIPPCLEDRIVPIGNAAGEGAKLCAISQAEFDYSKQLAAETEFLELASMPEFQDCYVDCLLFEEEDD